MNYRGDLIDKSAEMATLILNLRISIGSHFGRDKWRRSERGGPRYFFSDTLKFKKKKRSKYPKKIWFDFENRSTVTNATASATVTRKERRKFKAGGLNVTGLKVVRHMDTASEIGVVLWDEGLSVCAVQETPLDPAIDEIMFPGFHSGINWVSNLHTPSWFDHDGSRWIRIDHDGSGLITMDHDWSRWITIDHDRSQLITMDHDWVYGTRRDRSLEEQAACWSDLGES